MARKRPRYKKLFEQLKATEGTVPPNSRLSRFQEHLLGQSPIVVVNKPPEDSLKRYALAVFPFALEPEDETAASRYRVEITGYSYQALKDMGLAVADIGAAFIAGGEKDNSDYYPALVRPSLLASGYTGNENKVSAVTGDQYNYEPTRTFSIPVGRTTLAPDATTGAATANIGQSDELEVIRSVRGKIQSGTLGAAVKSIGYDAELFKPGSGASDATADTDIPTVTIGFGS